MSYPISTPNIVIIPNTSYNYDINFDETYPPYLENHLSQEEWRKAICSINIQAKESISSPFLCARIFSGLWFVCFVLVFFFIFFGIRGSFLFFWLFLPFAIIFVSLIIRTTMLRQYRIRTYLLLQNFVSEKDREFMERGMRWRLKHLDTFGYRRMVTYWIEIELSAAPNVSVQPTYFQNGYQFNPNQPYPNQPDPNQPYPNQPYPNQTYPNQTYPNQPYQNQPYPNQPYPNQPYPNQSYPNQTYPNPPYFNQTTSNSSDQTAPNNTGTNIPQDDTTKDPSSSQINP